MTPFADPKILFKPKAEKPAEKLGSKGVAQQPLATAKGKPPYFLSLFEIPKGVANKIEKIFRRFLWGDQVENRKVHLVAWTEVTKAKSKGGSSIVPIHLRNEALLCKWGWHFGRETNALWVRVLTTKSGCKQVEFGGGSGQVRLKDS